MRGICFEDVERVGVRNVADPRIEDPRDAVVRVKLAGLCGSDLHPFFGREVGLEPGTVMGHEFVGHVQQVGGAVRRLSVGDRVCAPFTTNCGECFYCQRGLTSRCVQGSLFGWRQNGKGLHGGQAEYVRVPLADATLMKLTDAISDEVALLIGDNLATGSYCADMLQIEPDGVYAVVGCGTVGLLAILSAFAMGARSIVAVDPNAERREIARQHGAIAVADDAAALEAVRQATDGRGADGVMELVGLPAAQRLAFDLLRPGGMLAVIGCHCTPGFAFSPTEAYDKNVTYRTGRCPARHYMPLLAAQLQTQPIDLGWCISHRFTIEDARDAYATFAYRRAGCVKAVIDF